MIHAIFLVRRAPTFARFGRFATGIAFGHHPITLQKIAKELQKIAKELCAKELCANANVFDFKKIGQNCCQLHASGGERKKNRKSRLVSAAPKKKRA